MERERKKGRERRRKRKVGGVWRDEHESVLSPEGRKMGERNKMKEIKGKMG